MRLHELYPFPEEKRERKRLGRGPASGLGCTSGKGNKGQNCRAGGGVPSYFEGGQMPLQRRLPKRGFKNPFRVKYQPVNLSRIETLFKDKTDISVTDLYERGLCSPDTPIKILGDGEISKGIKIQAHKFSKSALEKIKSAGGEALVLEG